MKNKFYCTVMLMLFTCVGQIAANAQVRSKVIAAPVPLSADQKLKKIRAVLQTQTRIKVDKVKLDSAKIGGSLCTLSVMTPKDGGCLLELIRPVSVVFAANYAELIDKSAGVTLSSLGVFFTPTQPGLYIVDFSLTTTDIHKATGFDLNADGQKTHQELPAASSDGHLIVPIQVTGTGNHYVELTPGGYAAFHSAQITKLY